MSEQTSTFDNIGFDMQNEYQELRHNGINKTEKNPYENANNYKTEVCQNDKMYENLQIEKSTVGVRNSLSKPFQPERLEKLPLKCVVIIGFMTVTVLLIMGLSMQVYIVYNLSHDKGCEKGLEYYTVDPTIIPGDKAYDDAVTDTINRTDVQTIVSEAIGDLKQYIQTQHTKVLHEINQKIDYLKLQTEVLQGLEERLDTMKNEITSNNSELYSGMSTQLSSMGYGQPYNLKPRVFHLRLPGGYYDYTFEEGQAACAAEGATMATPAQLQTAFELGMSKCACGWVADGTSRFPHWWPQNGCNGSNGVPQVVKCGTVILGKLTRDVYCFK